jgi:hypothetical protein
MNRVWLLAAFMASAPGASAGCGHGEPAAAPSPRRDAAAHASAPGDARVQLPARALGEPNLAAFAWRRRGGQAEFTLARKAEARGVWTEVDAACGRAIDKDPLHLEAQWLDAIALAKLGRLDAVTTPLTTAVAGDFAKWSEPSLEHPALEAWLTTDVGRAWRAQLDVDRATVVAALARSMIVLASGDLYSIDREGGRWLRLTHTFGGVFAAFAAPAARRVAYIVRKRDGRLAVGQVDLARVHTTHAVALGVTASASAPVAVVWNDRAPAGFWIGNGTGAQAWRVMDAEGLVGPAAKAKLPRPPGPWLEVHAKTARLHRTAEGVSADWDEHELAGALRVAASGKVVTAPSPYLVDGNTIVWTTDRAHLAFVVQDPEACTRKSTNPNPTPNPTPSPNPNPTPSPNPPPSPNPIPTEIAFVADASTGTWTEIARGDGGLAVEWLGDRELAVAGTHGVAVFALDGTTAPVVGAEALVTPAHPPRCTSEPADSDVDATLSPTSDDEP